MGRRMNPDRKVLLRSPEALHPMGHLSDFPHRRELGRRWTMDRPSAQEELTKDPVVYMQVAVTGRKPLGDLFYILRDGKTCNAYRVYFEEVVVTHDA